MTEPDYRKMKLGQLEHLAAGGDGQAQRALADLAKELSATVERAYDATREPLRRLSELEAEHERRTDAVRRRAMIVSQAEAEIKAGEIKRSQAMLEALTAMRGALEGSERREAASIRQARIGLIVGVAGLIIGAIGAAATVVALL
jgi:hypothetical protein